MGGPKRQALGRRSEAAARPIEFFRGFLRNPKEVGSIVPSSKFLTRRVLDCGGVADARVIVELGPGTGVLTREILRRMPARGKLVAVEISPRFAALLRKQNPDPRLVIARLSSGDLEAALAKADEREADLVVSGVPFSTMERGEGRRTLEAARRVLAPDGRFVAYQFRSHVRRLAEPVFGPAETQSWIWNLPPMRIYLWRREALPAPDALTEDALTEDALTEDALTEDALTEKALTEKAQTEKAQAAQET